MFSGRLVEGKAAFVGAGLGAVSAVSALTDTLPGCGCARAGDWGVGSRKSVTGAAAPVGGVPREGQADFF